MLNFIFNKNKPKTEVLFSDYLATHAVKKLQIGCGRKNILEGWLNTDIVCKKEQVGYLDAGKKFPFANEVFQFIFSEHIFEHLDFKQASNMLNESYRVLKPGGTIRISTPDLNFLINLYLKPEEPLHKDYITWATKKHVKDVAGIFKTNQYSPVFVINNFFRDWGHQIIHNFESISLMLKQAGFIDITQCSINESSIPVLQNLEMHGNTIPSEFNQLETMVVEAIKKCQPYVNY